MARNRRASRAAMRRASAAILPGMLEDKHRWAPAMKEMRPSRVSIAHHVGVLEAMLTRRRDIWLETARVQCIYRP